MIANHPEREQIRLENVLSALGNPLRLEIIARWPTAASRAAAAGGQGHHDPPLARPAPAA
jgi:hypothetical protein